MMKKSPVTIALTGNPNSGKTTVFNAITGARQHVGNYPGVTVEKVEGDCRIRDTDIRLVDLPGTYSLTAYSPEELVARDFLIKGRPDAVVAILDATNLERNLYLAVQIMELGSPLVLALNMADLAAQQGIEFNLELMRKLLGTRIVPTVGSKGKGVQEVLCAALEAAAENPPSEQPARGLRIPYGAEIDRELDKLEALLTEAGATMDSAPIRWLAIKLLEGDTNVRERLADKRILDAADEAATRIEKLLGDTPEALIADRRYGFIAGACQECVRSTAESRRSVSDQIDAIVVHRLLGLPIFFGLMYLVFNLTFTLGNPPMDWIEAGFAWLGTAVGSLWPAGSDSLLRSLLLDGIIAGVGGVVTFLPNILLLFLAVAFLEDSGYMSRAAFLMDKPMHKIGLHGKSFVPMLIGFGCTVPAILATRTLENRRDRLTTMLVVPLMSCGARLPIYALIIPAFFAKKWQGPLLWIIYMLGIILAIFSAKLLNSTILRGETPPFVMELPPYRMPTLKGLIVHTWNRGGSYLKKAGTVILGISIILWGLQQWPGLPADQANEFARQEEALAAAAMQENLTDDESANFGKEAAKLDAAIAEAKLQASFLGRIGRGVEPVLRTCGFDWKISTAMLGAIAAKEVFVSQMSIVYSLGEPQDEEEPLTLRDKLKSHYTPLVGLCIMLFCLISAPCMATIAATRKESNSWKWALFQFAGLTFLAWLITTAVYQIGSLIF